jgi:coniferyl-aldehyde dehydrogenase
MKTVSNSEIDRVFKVQKAAFAKNRNPSLKERLDRLRTLDTMLVENRQPIRNALHADFNQHHDHITDLFESGGVISRGRYIQAVLADYLKPKDQPLIPQVHGSSTAQIIRQPLGVIGNISPWNFPIESSLVMVADMLAAGNRVIVKPSELAPATSDLLFDMVSKYFDEAILAVTPGDISTSQHFASVKWDHLCFTGSGKIGSLVAQAAAKNLTPLTLELGGKNPTLFAADGFEEDLVTRFLYFRVFKAGQVCTSPDYVLVPRGREKEWVELAKKAWTGMYPNYVGHPDATGAINKHHFDRVMGYVQECRDRGHEVISLNGDAPDPATRQIPMYVVVNPGADLACRQEEIFGPLTPIISYDNVDQAIDMINSGPAPLAGYIVTRDNALADRYAMEVKSGGCGVNVFGFQGAEPSIPFGGVGASGVGCHAGVEGFANFSHTKSVFKCADDNPLMHAIRGPLGGMAAAFSDAVFTPLPPAE